MAAEITFLCLLGFVLALAGLIAMSTVARVVEPRGLRALLRRIAGKA